MNYMYVLSLPSLFTEADVCIRYNRIVKVKGNTSTSSCRERQDGRTDVGRESTLNATVSQKCVDWNHVITEHDFDIKFLEPLNSKHKHSTDNNGCMSISFIHHCCIIHKQLTINAKTQFITQVNSAMTHQKQQKLEIWGRAQLEAARCPKSDWKYCWLGHQTYKNRRPYNLYCVGADVKPSSINQQTGNTILSVVMCENILVGSTP